MNIKTVSKSTAFTNQFTLLAAAIQRVITKPEPCNKFLVSKSKALRVSHSSPPNIITINKNKVAIAPTYTITKINPIKSIPRLYAKIATNENNKIKNKIEYIVRRDKITAKVTPINASIYKLISVI
jgi:hypothetical protein